jgi:ribulose-bisphosphate carboxylase large chain
VDFGIVLGRAIFGHPEGPAAGAKSILQGWEAVAAGVDMEEYPRDRSELSSAMEMNR